MGDGVVKDEGRAARDHTQSVALVVRKHWAGLLAAVIPAIVTSILAYTSATSTGREESGTVKDKAESGYQVARNALEELRQSNRSLLARVAALDVELAGIKRALKSIKRPVVPVAKVVAPPPPRQPALPANLDKALQVQRALPTSADPPQP